MLVFQVSSLSTDKGVCRERQGESGQERERVLCVIWRQGEERERESTVCDMETGGRERVMYVIWRQGGERESTVCDMETERGEREYCV